MEHIITELSKYLIILLMMLFTFQCFTIFRKHDLEDKYQVLRKQIVLMLFMNFVAYGVLYMKTKETNMIFPEHTGYKEYKRNLYQLRKLERHTTDIDG